MYTQFFIHAWVLQSYHLYKASTQSDISQLDYRKRLLEELLPLCSLQDTAKALGSTPQCCHHFKKGRDQVANIPRAGIVVHIIVIVVRSGDVCLVFQKHTVIKGMIHREKKHLRTCAAKLSFTDMKWCLFCCIRSLFL